ncbi:hypothetical protein V495_03955 [Pseudogymnoascus sp. VKM F-4514 (FW-929)]|nr:hypothetical protein V495_03955 [Pseudogymnoascus sp. VKM F-4514 (FW-929)]KFY52107.1 hypothetical protein V497_08637 [Pseudogymnoascus sp. VKM F-4516 (FW-969)]
MPPHSSSQVLTGLGLDWAVHCCTLLHGRERRAHWKEWKARKGVGKKAPTRPFTNSHHQANKSQVSYRIPPHYAYTQYYFPARTTLEESHHRPKQPSRTPLSSQSSGRHFRLGAAAPSAPLAAPYVCMQRGPGTGNRSTTRRVARRNGLEIGAASDASTFQGADI